MIARRKYKIPENIIPTMIAKPAVRMSTARSA